MKTVPLSLSQVKMIWGKSSQLTCQPPGGGPHPPHCRPLKRSGCRKQALGAHGSGNHSCPRSVASARDGIIFNFSFLFETEDEITFPTSTTEWLCLNVLEKSSSCRVPPYLINTLTSKRPLGSQLRWAFRFPSQRLGRHVLYDRYLHHSEHL